ncbi:MAG: hypothetical protein AAGF01_05945 [Cyanobacteria bacterium P01_G01_bin.38]
MQKSLLKLGSLAGTVAVLSVGLSAPAIARPYPDRLGICYSFNGDEVDLTQPCVISSGYGAGAHYVALQWIDGSRTPIVMINACEPEEFDESGFCRYTVDELDAAAYQRDVFLNATTISDEENLSCFKVIETGNSVCYRFDWY